MHTSHRAPVSRLVSVIALLATSSSLLSAQVIQTEHTTAATAVRDGIGGAVPSEDASAESGVISPLGGSASVGRISTAEKVATLTWVHRTSRAPRFYGAEAAGSITNSLASLFGGGEVQPAGRLGIHFGWIDTSGRADASSNSVNWVVLRGGIEGAKYVLLDTTAAFGDQVKKEFFNGGTGSISFNRLWNGTLISGLSLGYRRESNGGDLKESEVETTIERTDVGTGAVRTVKEKVTARRGEYVERDTYPIGLDLFWLPAPGDPVGVTFYGRQILARAKPVTRFGIGLWALKPGASTQSLGGIVVELDDVFENVPEAETAESRRLKASLVVGLPLFSR